MNIADEFPQADGLVYLNHAAVAPWPRRTAVALARFADENVRYGASRYAQRFGAVEARLREQLRRLINAPSTDDIALLKSTSEALSVVAEGLDWRRGDTVVSANEEFPSNRIPWEAQARHGVTLRQVDLRRDDPEAALIAACDETTRVLSVSSVQYASGIKMDLARLGAHCRAHNILFCVDAIQSLGAQSFDAQEIHADFVMADGHKWMLGPEGAALFYTTAEQRRRLRLRQYGWHMVENAGDYDAAEWTPAATARRFECGSPNMLGIHGLSASLSLLLEVGLETIESAIAEHIDFLYQGLSALPRVHINTPAAAHRRAGIISFAVQGLDSATLHKRLLAQNIVCACRGGAARFSPHFYNTRAQLRQALATVVKIQKDADSCA